MKRIVTILLGVAVLLTCVFVPVAVTNAADLVIAVGDQPYYTHGPSYVRNGVRLVWVAGHWGHRNHQQVWVHGHYVRR